MTTGLEPVTEGATVLHSTVELRHRVDSGRGMAMLRIRVLLRGRVAGQIRLVKKKKGEKGLRLLL